MPHANKTKVERLIRHCEMFLYAYQGSPEIIINPVANDFWTFGLLHLICTMYITTDFADEKPGGAFHRLLDPMEQGHLLKGVDSALDLKVGESTLRKFLQTKRNKLATHRELDFLSLPKEVQDVSFDEKALKQYDSAMTMLKDATYILLKNLLQLTSPGEK
jgi:hypothetical protein